MPLDIEMMRSTDLQKLDDEPKLKRVLEKHRVPAYTGPTSANPGVWLTNAFVDCLVSDSIDKHECKRKLAEQCDREQLASARAVLESFCDGPRCTWKPVPSQTDRDSTLLLADEIGPTFKIIQQPNVLSGPELRKWRAEHFTKEDLKALEEAHREEHKEALRDRDRDSDEIIEEKYDNTIDRDKIEERLLSVLADEAPQMSKERELPQIGVQLGTVELLNAHYRAWASNPGESTREQVFITLHHHLSYKSELKTAGDEIRKVGLTEDFQMDFLLKIMERLDRQLAGGRILDHPSAYISSAWETGRMDKYKVLKIRRKKAECSVDLPPTKSDESDTDESDLTSFDVKHHKDWSSGSQSHSVMELDAEEVRETRLAKIQTLRPVDRDIVGMHLLKHTQSETGAVYGITQPAMSKRLARIRAKLTASKSETAK